MYMYTYIKFNDVQMTTKNSHQCYASQSTHTCAQIYYYYFLFTILLTDLANPLSTMLGPVPVRVAVPPILAA